MTSMSSDDPFTDDLAAVFSDMFGSVLRQPDVHTQLRITDAEAATGVTRDLTVTRADRCAACEGRGGATPADVKVPCAACDGKGGREHAQGFFMVKTTCDRCKGAGALIANPCARCTGSGITTAEATVTVTVPPGLEHGQVVRFEGQGNVTADGSRGALVVYLLVGERADTRADDLQSALQRMMIEPNVPRAIVRQPGGGPTMSPPLILALVVGAVLLLLSFLR